MTTEFVHDRLGGDFRSLRGTLTAAMDGLRVAQQDGDPAAPEDSGLGIGDLTDLETFITDQFLPQLRAAIAGRTYTPELDPAAAVYAATPDSP